MRGDQRRCCILQLMSKIRIAVPTEFEFAHTLAYLRRSPKELLHRVEGEYVIKALELDGRAFVMRVSERDSMLQAEVLNGKLSVGEKALANVQDIRAVAPMALRQRRSQFMVSFFNTQREEDDQIRTFVDELA